MSGLAAQAKRWLPRLLALGLLVFVLQRAGIVNVWQTVARADVPSVAIATVLVLPFVVARAGRWLVVLRDFRIIVRLVEATRLYAIGLYIGTVTPGQAGDAIKAWYLSHKGESLALSLLSCVVDRLFDILVLALIATTALVVFWPSESGQWTVGSAIVVGVAMALLFLARPDARAWFMNLPLLRLAWRPVEGWLRKKEWGQALLESRLHFGTIGLAFVMTAGGFGITLTRVYLVFHAVGIDLPLLTFLAVASVTVFASLVSVAGVGSRDLALVAMLEPMGFGADQAVAASVLILFLTLSNLVPGLLIWLGRPVPLGRASADS